MNEPKKPLLMFLGGLALVAFSEMLLTNTSTLFVQAYGVGLLMLGCSVFYGLVDVMGNRRLHTPIGISASAAGLLVGSVVTWVVAGRFLSML